MSERFIKRIAAHIAAACLLALAAASCSSLEKKGEGAAEVRILVGDVSIKLGNESYPASVGMRIMSHNALVTGAASKVKVASGGINIFVNERALLRFLPPAETDSCVLAAERGAYCFAVPAGGRSVLCRFGDMTIRIAAGTFAALTIDTSGRSAEFFVMGGSALVKRGAESKELSSCDVAALDAAGISVDEAAMSERDAAVERLKRWVGETFIDNAIAHGMCKSDQLAAAGDSQAVGKRDVRLPEAAKDFAKPVVQTAFGDSVKKAAQTQQLKQADVFMIEQIVGPKRIYVGEEFTLKCGTSGRATVTKYVWRFDGAGDLLIFKTDAPQVTAVLEKAGAFLVTCEITGDNGTLASQTVRIGVMSGKAEAIAAGSSTGDTAKAGAASPRRRRPTADAGPDVVPRADGVVNLNGTGRSPDGRIVKYEWDFDGDGVFDWSSESSGEVERAFKAFASPVLRVTDSEGGTAADTMRVVICPQDMALISNAKFCADRYEWPNQRGALPLTNVSWQEAANTCASVGKRLCAPDEWKRACRNGKKYSSIDGNDYPYGDEFESAKCNTLGNPKSKNALMPAGAFSECAGGLGVYDMSGNAAEWTASAAAKAPALGGFYQSGAEESACESGVSLDKDKKYLYTGFRCCK
ncbi:hypothetical protein R80B4_00440 [Fibrobacteres bacterium R8-0-B4]